MNPLSLNNKIEVFCFIIQTNRVHMSFIRSLTYRQSLRYKEPCNFSVVNMCSVAIPKRDGNFLVYSNSLRKVLNEKV